MTDTDTDSTNKRPLENEPLDVLKVLDIHKGTPLQVYWELVDTEIETTSLHQFWWDCEILERTDRFHTLTDDEDGTSEQLPIYTLKYKPFPPDYPDESTVDACFISAEELYDIETDNILKWKLLDDHTKMSSPNLKSSTSAEVDRFVDALVNKLVQTKFTHLKNLPFSEQFELTERIKRGKKLLGDRLKQHFDEHDKMDENDVQTILKEVGPQLSALKKSRSL